MAYYIKLFRAFWIYLIGYSTLIISCNQISFSNKEKESNNKEFKIDINAEIIKWKSDLVKKNRIGNPCNFESIESKKAQDWSKNNKDQLNGLPKNETEIYTAQSDFDNDGKEDLIIYFMAQNCSGHNGGTPSFAKIVYANGYANDMLMDTIVTSIILAYNQKKAKNTRLMDITDNYLKENVSISFKNGIVGEFSLYTNKDAHCCPSYNGTYTYNVKTKKAAIELVTLEK